MAIKDDQGSACSGAPQTITSHLLKYGKFLFDLVQMNGISVQTLGVAHSAGTSSIRT